MNVLITGGAGFIGFHLAMKLLSLSDYNVTLVDNVNDYYDVQLKKDRLAEIEKTYGGKFDFDLLDITDQEEVKKIFESKKFDLVVNLAAQAGVRYAKENPRKYLESNIDGFFNIIDEARRNGCDFIIYASSSSVYGENSEIPFKESAKCDNPLSIYASTKLSNEMIAESYKNTFKMRCIGLRFFNVYGPWGRPDAVYYIWSDALVNAKEIELRDNGDMYRDMTYVADVVESIKKLIEYGNSDTLPMHEIYNVGNETPVRTGDLLNLLVEKLKIEPRSVLSVPRGDVEPKLTRADTSKLKSAIGYAPETSYFDGIDKFCEWYKEYYNI